MPPPSQSEDLYLRARALDERERDTFLARACDTDAALRAAVEDLLAAERQADADGFLSGDEGGGGAPGSFAGQTIGGYRIERELGRGGQATVYLAHESTLARPVALKVLAGLQHPDQVSTMAQRFRREASALANLDHPGLCTIYDTGIDGGVAWIAMRYVDGVTLAELLTEHESGLERALGSVEASTTSTDEPARTTTRGLRLTGLFEQVARALHAAHERGVVHRDVKPANVMIARNGQPVLLDFGVAHAMQDDDGPGLTRTTDVLGTPSYMAPEQIRADGRIDALDSSSAVVNAVCDM